MRQLKMLRFFIVLVFLFDVLRGGFAQTQNRWQMQPLHMPTRWAKKVSPSNTHMEYPRPQMARANWQNLNGLWQYAITKKDLKSIPDRFDGNILVPYPIESALSGVKRSLTPDENLWYRTSFVKPNLQAEERLLLHFGAVDWQSTVFVNGNRVGQHTGGYNAFSFDITDFLKKGDNVLQVKVFDPTDQGFGPHGKQVLKPTNIYYTPSSGIWQTVWLERVPKNYISRLRTTPDIDKGLLQVNVQLSRESDPFIVELTALEGGKVISLARGKAGENIEVPMKNARLWSPDDPFLYDLSVKLIKDNKTVDEVTSYFGMRKVSIQKDRDGFDRIFLNNQYTYNLGTLDQGFWPDGLYTAPTDEALAFDIKAIKLMGFNTIRKHIKVEPARWYYHADRSGILVWQDFVNPNQALPPGAKEEFEKEVKETMDQLHNFPCITTWVVFNERWGAFDQLRLTEWIKKYDPSRLVNGHSGELLYVNDRLRAPSDKPYVGSDMTDVHSYPGPMNALMLDRKARVLGEFGGVGVSVPYHQWDDLQGWGYVQVTPLELKDKYETMTMRLKELEREGLSASIYTQPFDVEGEENGLFTYDREVIKMPLNEIRKINSVLVKQTAGFDPDKGFDYTGFKQ